MQGQNITATLYRATQGADDTTGGAQRAAYVAYVSGCRVRLQQRHVSVDLRAQGITTDKIFDAFIQPGDVGVMAMDMLIPTSGKFANVRFLVTAVINPSLETLTSQRAHKHLQLERWDDGKMIDVQ